MLLRALPVPSGCWEWQGHIAAVGYGEMHLAGKKRGAHRVSYESFVGPIPPGMYVMHSCDNRVCVNPSHLSLGTHLDNVKDMHDKGRHYKKLTAEQVAEVRRLSATSGLTQKAIGRTFGVAPATISAIVTGRNWKECPA